ncbi:protein-tyrosine phosphatase-like protein [Aspergillus pseudodeflectus]|uniref:protein-tyrosine-phosphatase n=1 Tax=Aspergillus pseudodeflectus TaxID=176178 RepID=A0ABR4KVH1_9EURO
MDPLLPGTTISPVLAVPGLYISDRFAARSNSLLTEHRITHILSILRWEDRPRPSSYKDATDDGTETVTNTGSDLRRITRKHVDMDDDPMEDLLAHLDGMLDWVHDAIIGTAPLDGAEEDQVNAGKESGVDTSTRQDQGRVLVHCNQGVSRSGSVVVAYIMKYLSLPYAAALLTARQSRPVIAPNIGFEYQLRMWERCGFGVFLPGGEDQENDQEEEEGQVQLIEESEYAAWKEDVAQVYSHEQLKDFQRAREDCIRRMVARLGVLMKDDT